MLARSWPCMKREMAIFDGRHPDIRVLVNNPGANIATHEYLGYRYGPASVGNTDLGTDREVPHSGFDQFFCLRRTVNMDWLCALSIPRQRQERSEARGVIVVMVRNKNRSDVSDLNTRLRETPRDAVPGVNNVMRAVDG